MSEKELEIVHSERNLYKIQYKGGGQLPKELCSEYNHKGFAQRDIDRYLATRRDYPSRGRVKKSGN